MRRGRRPICLGRDYHTLSGSVKHFLRPLATLVPAHKKSPGEPGQVRLAVIAPVRGYREG